MIGVPSALNATAALAHTTSPCHQQGALAMRITSRTAAYTAAANLGVTGVCIAAGPAAAASAGGIKLTSISFEQPTVDATSGGVTDTLD
jgi:hypothetical protein